MNPQPPDRQSPAHPSEVAEIQAGQPLSPFGLPAVCRDQSVPPPSTPPNLLTLLAQLAALPADQRAVIAKLLTTTPTPDIPAGLDDSLPRGFERPTGEAG
jgi:hypothetical protein